ncbi:MAG: hypothetical protein U5K51_17225 [Flavobacteriaceae bacterium]|nr:hypothetical protein [Flavobacteriaceae bacterium]
MFLVGTGCLVPPGRKFDLYYAEAMTGVQSQNFYPTDYVDITAVLDQKHKACFVHKSQKIEEEYPLYHGKRWNLSGAWSTIATMQRLL